MPAIGKQESQFEPAPIGLHPAICCALVDMGTQEKTYGKDTKTGHFWWVQWELLIDEKQPNGEAFTVNKEWLNSGSDKSNMQKDLAAWRGRKLTKEETEKAFDIVSIVGSKCMLNVTQAPSADGSRIYAKVASISPVMKGLALPAPTIEPKVFVMHDEEPHNFREDVLEGLYEKLRVAVKSSPEYECIKVLKKPLSSLKKTPAAVASGGEGVGKEKERELNDEIPF